MLAPGYTAELLRLGREAGLDAVGVAVAGPFERARHALEVRKQAGLHAGMAFTYRNPGRSTDPRLALPGARALLAGARGYLVDEPPRPEGPTGRVARYAWADHYAELRAALTVVAERLRRDGWKARVLADDNALVDREAAYRAGLGWFGRNANLLLPGHGSWYVLGSVVTTAPLTPADAPIPDGCGACHACVPACPTGAIVAPAVIDANRCLAWLVQRPGIFPRDLRVALGDRIYGCDDCQEPCPPNRRLARPRPYGGLLQAWVPLLELLAADDATLLERHGRWYVPRREPRWLRRNALVALGNVGDRTDPAVVDALARWLTDPDPMLRAHAVWAAARLDRRDLLVAVAADQAPEVRAELDAVGFPPDTTVRA